MYYEKLNAILDGNDFEVRREEGNIEKAFADADQVIERTYESPVYRTTVWNP